MKKLIILALILLPVMGMSQAHLGSTEYKIRTLYPGKVFERGTTDRGTYYIATKFQFGLFVYYFDSRTKMTSGCIQIPYSSATANGQAEIYNSKYTILSSRSWRAYLPNGGVIDITLEYSQDLKTFVFLYNNEENY